VEEAIRGRLTARHQRLARIAARLNEKQEVNLIDLMNRRASNLAERATALKKLADAWKPLYDSLDANQRDRLRFLAAYVLREMRDAVEARRAQSEDQEDENEGEY
jgi:ABC-type transporter Mla subunit MlaD